METKSITLNFNTPDYGDAHFSVYGILRKGEKFMLPEYNDIFSLSEKNIIIQNLIEGYTFNPIVCDEDKYGNLSTDNQVLNVVKSYINNEFKCNNLLWSELTPFLQGCIEDYTFKIIKIRPSHKELIDKNRFNMF